MRYFILVLSVILLAGCHYHVPVEPFTLQGNTVALRQLQTRRFDTQDELKLLQAGSALLQDLGFTIDESEPSLGVITGSKSRDATNTGQIIGMVLLGALTGVTTPVDYMQNIRALLVTRPLGSAGINVRVTFQRIIIDSEGTENKVDTLDDARLYQEFFEKLSKAVFLQANNI